MKAILSLTTKVLFFEADNGVDLEILLDRPFSNFTDNLENLLEVTLCHVGLESLDENLVVAVFRDVSSEFDLVTVESFCIEIIESFVVAFFVEESNVSLAGVGHANRVHSNSLSNLAERGKLFLNFIGKVH